MSWRGPLRSVKKIVCMVGRHGAVLLLHCGHEIATEWPNDELPKKSRCIACGRKMFSARPIPGRKPR